MFTRTDRNGVERQVAEEVEVTETHSVSYGEWQTELEIDTDLPDEHTGGRYVEPSVYYTLVDDIGVDPEAYRIHIFAED